MLCPAGWYRLARLMSGRPEQVGDQRRGSPGLSAAAGSVCPKFRLGYLLCFFFTCLVVLLPSVAGAVPPGTIILNQAVATYSHGDNDSLQVTSNEVTVITVGIATPSSLELLAHAPGNPAAELVDVGTTSFSPNGTFTGPFVISPPPTPLNLVASIDLTAPVPLVVANRFRVGEPVFLRLTDFDQNRDSSLIDTATIIATGANPGDTEVLRFPETAPASGTFVGYLQSYESLTSGVFDGRFTAMDQSVIDAQYVDATDPRDTSFASGIFVAAPGELFVSKRTDREIASIGEFVRYVIRVENLSDIDLLNVNVIDRLPRGVRYQEGSTVYDQQSSDNPETSDDGRTLTFVVPLIPARGAVEISYVIQISSTLGPGDLINYAHATTTTDTSNTAQAVVHLREDLLQSRSFILGRVIVGNCDSTVHPDSTNGLKGARVYLDDGTAVATDERGFYHFEGVLPGAHVVQLDMNRISSDYVAADCDNSNRFAGSLYSQFVDLQPGTMWRADFHLSAIPLPPPPEGLVTLGLESTLEDSTVLVMPIVAGEIVPATNIRLTVRLPEGLVYVRGTAELEDSSIADPDINGNMLTFRLGDREGDWTDTISFVGTFRSEPTNEELPIEALCMFDTPSEKSRVTPRAINMVQQRIARQRIPLPVVVLHPRFSSFSSKINQWAKVEIGDIADELRKTRIAQVEITGHTDSVAINPRSQHIFADNYELSVARAKSVGRHLMEVFGLDSSQVTIKGMGPDQPVAPNATPEGRFLNRRVELRIMAEGEEQYSVYELLSGSDDVSLVTIGATAVRSKQDPSPIKKNSEPLSMPDFEPAQLDTVSSVSVLLWPPENYYPSIPSLKLAVRHDAQRTVKLHLNGKEVSSLNYLDRVTSLNGLTAVTRWSGVDLQQGDNNVLVIVSDSARTFVDTLSRHVYYSGPPVHVALVEDLSVLYADGQTPIEVAVRVTDENGYPAREGVIGEISIDPPYATQREFDLIQSNPLSSAATYRNQYEVGPNGIAMIVLQPTALTGEAVLHFHFIDFEQDVRLWLRPRQRDWILVGLAEGTVGYNTVTGHMESSAAAGIEENYYSDGKLAFFAKGRVKGQWLLTMAYDSERENATTRNSLFETIDPNSYYTLYGDATVQTSDAPRSGKVYIKIERDNFYALFGDFNTGLTFTELTRYSRSLSGMKTELYTERGNLSVFVSETEQAFARDEIAGDGTSGPYNLSYPNILANSEKIILQARDRYRNEIILDERPLRRHIDYNIDYMSGTIFLKEPVSSRNADLNPLFVVIDYETLDGSDKTYNVGARGAARLIGNKLETGATIIRENHSGSKSYLGGFDATYDLTRSTRFNAELAYSKTDNSGVTTEGRGYLAEMIHNGGKLSGRLYFREHGAGFGLGHQNSVESGTRKVGFETTRRFKKRITLDGLAYRNYNLGSNAERDVAELRANYSGTRFTVHTGFRYAEDRLGSGEKKLSQQLMTGGDYRMFRERIIVRVNHDQSLARNQNRDFPTRTRLGAEYRPVQPVSLFAEQEFTRGEQGKTESSRFGIQARPWAGSNMNSHIDRKFTEDGLRLSSNLGLKQTLRLNRKWSVDGSLDHSRSLIDPSEETVSDSSTSAIGSFTDFTAGTFGMAYRAENWSWSSRFEVRDGAESDKYTFTAGSYGEARPGLGLSVAIQYLKNIAEAEDTRSNARLSLAYRPVGSPWTVLDRLDLVTDRHQADENNFDNWRLVNNLNANYQPGTRTQFALQAGTKFVKDKIDENQFEGFTGMFGIEVRRDLNRRWDVGLHGGSLHSFAGHQTRYTVGLSVGRNVVNNTWISCGYNFAGFDDRDFSGGNYTSAGPYLRFRLKLDQQSVVDIVRSLGLFRTEKTRSPGDIK